MEQSRKKPVQSEQQFSKVYCMAARMLGLAQHGGTEKKL